MLVQKKFGGRKYSPNQEFRRDEVIDAACEILRTQGVASVTVRTVAKQAGLSSGAIHYYFSDIQELLDLAYAKISERYFAKVFQLSRQIGDPVNSFWHFIMSYLKPWSTHSSMPLLWCEYYVTSVRSGRIEGVRDSHQRTIEIFEAAMKTSGLKFKVSADGLFRHTNGTVLSMGQIPVGMDTLLAELAQLLGVEAPQLGEIACGVPGCKLCNGIERGGFIAA